MKKIFCLYLLLTLAGASFSQNNKPAEKNDKTISVLLSPQYLFNNQGKVFLNLGITEIHTLVLSPSIYFGETNLYKDKYHKDAYGNSAPNYTDEVQGFGIEAMHQISLKKSDHTVLFFSYGVGYNKINLTYQDFGWNTYTDHGLEYFRYSLTEQKDKIVRWDYLGLLGVKFYNDVVDFNMFFGPVYKNSALTTTSYEPRTYTNPILDHGYTGWTYRVGFSIGFFIL